MTYINSPQSIAKRAEKNPNWIGDKIKYHGVHSWINRNYEKPELCQECGLSKAYDLANISQKYKRDINDWEWLCRRCHMKKDGRLKKLLAYSESRRNGVIKNCTFCNKEMRITPGQIRAGGGKHCSHACANRSRKNNEKKANKNSIS